jgi:hypothetical protein
MAEGTALERLDQDWKATVTDLNNNPSLIHCNDGKLAAADASTTIPKILCQQWTGTCAVMGLVGGGRT